MLDPLVAGEIETNRPHQGGADRLEEPGDKVTVDSTQGTKGPREVFRSDLWADPWRGSCQLNHRPSVSRDFGCFGLSKK